MKHSQPKMRREAAKREAKADKMRERLERRKAKRGPKIASDKMASANSYVTVRQQEARP